MQLNEAILQLKKYQGYLPLSDQEGMRKHAFDLTDETVDTILTALSRVTIASAQSGVLIPASLEHASFEGFLTARNDEIDNAAYALLCALAGSELAWDMEKIGNLVDDAEALLTERGVDTCRPFYEGDEEMPCFAGSDCKNLACAFRAKSEKAI